jgi:hypothetical protein
MHVLISLSAGTEHSLSSHMKSFTCNQDECGEESWLAAVHLHSARQSLLPSAQLSGQGRSFIRPQSQGKNHCIQVKKLFVASCRALLASRSFALSRAHRTANKPNSLRFATAANELRTKIISMAYPLEEDVKYNRLCSNKN